METITNFRDLGGLKNKAGHAIRPNKLLRSGELSRISAIGQELLLNDYRLQAVIDLRSQDEVTERPDILIAETKYSHIDIFETIEDQGASMADFISIGSADKSRGYMKKTYQTMALNPGAQKGFQKMIETVLAMPADSSILFHCFAGKDRTGVSAALLLEILEMPKDVIYKDYLATNALRVKENEELVGLALQQGMPEKAIDAMKIALTVEPEFLDAYYQSVTENYGDMPTYIENTLHISKNSQKDLQNQLLR